MLSSSQNLIYALICGNCKKTYKGETGDVLRNRVRVHRQQIDNPSLMNLKVSHNISQCSKHVQKNDKFQIIPIYKIKKMIRIYVDKWKLISSIC